MTSNRRKKPIRYAVLAISAAIAFFFTFCRSAAPDAAYPLERAWGFIKRNVRTRVAGAIRGASASAENAGLRRQIAALSLLQGECERLEQENARLRSALEYRDRVGADWLAAAVLSKSGGAASAHSVIRVNRGESDGIRRGAIVVSPAGLVGKIGTVTKRTAEVYLLTDPSVRVACEIRCGGPGETVRGILAGGGDERLIMEHISAPDGVMISERSSVFTSGLGGVFPAGIPVGTFTEILSSDDEQVRTAAIEPAVDFEQLEEVFIRRER